MDQRVTVYTAR